jgi:subfamily B ATP-binding cassette protein MsbA
MRGVYLRSLGYFRPSRRWIALLLSVIFLATVIGLLQVWPLAILVDAVLAPSGKTAGVAGWFQQAVPQQGLQIALLASAALLLRLASELLSLLRSMLNVRIGNDGLFRIRCDLFCKLQSLSVHDHSRRPVGDAIFRLTDDTNGLQTILSVAIEVTVAIVTLVVMLGVMLSRNVALTGIALGVVPLLVLVNRRYGRTMGQESRHAKQWDSNYLSSVQRTLTTIPLMQAFCREGSEFGRFQQAAHSRNQAWHRFHWNAACYRMWVGAIFGTGSALLMGYGGYLVYRNQSVAPDPHGMTVGDLVIFVSYLAMFYDPLCKLTGASATIQSGLVGAQRVFEVLDQRSLVQDQPHAASLPLQPRTLELRDVSFQYPQGPRVLKDIQVTIPPGTMVAFVGPSGVGKSSLLNLLPRFYDPTAGGVYLDGQDVRGIRLRDLRAHVALVLQEGLLLPSTVAENIAYGRPEASMREIRMAAQLAGADEFIQAMPAGYETLITERGQNLSGGQRQRLAIARALLTDAPIIVLDEPTSSLDSENEQLVVETLRSLKGIRTLVVVSHRLSTVVDCDQIFVMSDGRIIERGTPGELLAQGGRYADLARQQLQAPKRASDPLAA